MILRRIQPKGSAGARAHAGQIKTATTKSSVCTPAVRKPSERFERKTLVVRSKCSNSERIRVADLGLKLEKDVGSKDTLNGNSQFNGYRPGCSGAPG